MTQVNTDYPIGGILSVSRTFTDAQTKALPTSGLVIIPAPGSGKIIVPMFGIANFKSVAGYTNIDGAFKNTLIYGSPSTTIVTVGSTLSILLASNVSGLLSDLVLFSSPSFFIDAAAANKALSVKFDNAAAGNLTGGNAANTFELTVLYTINDAG